jgi:hypothetical protein
MPAVEEAERPRAAQPPTDGAPHETERSLKRGAVWALGAQIGVQAIRESLRHTRPAERPVEARVC